MKDEVTLKIDTMPQSSGIVFIQHQESLPSKQVLNAELSVPNPLPIQILNKSPGLLETPSTWVALAALFVSVGNFFWNQWQVKKARRRAIVDEFWIQSVIYPETIKPLLETLRALPAKLPDPNKTYRQSTIDKFYKHYSADHSRYATALTDIGIIDTKLLKIITDKFDLIEDEMAEYTFRLTSSSHSTSERENQRRTVLTTIEKFQTDLMKYLKSFQDNL